MSRTVCQRSLIMYEAIKIYFMLLDCWQFQIEK